MGILFGRGMRGTYCISTTVVTLLLHINITSDLAKLHSLANVKLVLINKYSSKQNKESCHQHLINFCRHGP